MSVNFQDTVGEEKKTSIVFQCHICNVSMNEQKVRLILCKIALAIPTQLNSSTALSILQLLQEHVQLESHKTLMEKTSESYQAQAAALRLNMQEAYGRIDSLKRNNRHIVCTHRSK
jgi:hypothetical protein